MIARISSLNMLTSYYILPLSIHQKKKAKSESRTCVISGDSTWKQFRLTDWARNIITFIVHACRVSCIR